MGRRYILKGKSRAFVERDRKGRFKNWVSKGKSLKADRRIKAKKIVKSGYGHLGDVRVSYLQQIKQLEK